MYVCGRSLNFIIKKLCICEKMCGGNNVYQIMCLGNNVCVCVNLIIKKMCNSEIMGVRNNVW